MSEHSCMTYLAVGFDFDTEKNARFIRAKRTPEPEQIGITDKPAVERALAALGCAAVWDRHGFVIGRNCAYDVDVNNMLRVTLADAFGKERELARLASEYGVKISLVIVPQIAADSTEPNQLLSLDGDIIEFLYKSGAALDLDYYIV